MSLVSYADSDDNEEEDASEFPVEKNEGGNGKKPLQLDTTKVETKASDEKSKAEEETTSGDSSDTRKPKSIGNLFSSLPAPWMSTVTWANKSSGKKALKKEREQTIKISLPSRPHLADDSDSDDEDNIRKKAKPFTNSEKSSGLFSLLPKPKHSVVVKENNPNRPVAKLSNRPLIPDSVRKKKTQKETPQEKKVQTEDNGSDDNDSDDGGSFFLLSESNTSSLQDASTIQVPSGCASTFSTDEVAEGCVDETQPRTTEDIVSSVTQSFSNAVFSSGSGTKQETSSRTNVNLINDEPTPSGYFQNSNRDTHNNPQGYSYQDISNTPEYSVDCRDDNSENAGYVQTNNPYYDYYNSEQYNQTATNSEPTCPVWQIPSQPTIEETPDEMKRILGKRGRGEGNINIIDVKVDDQVGSSQEWKSNYRKEDADYKPPSKKKDNLPSSQQRKKHQITYLAFQAKEREWELRNQWSANRQTRRQTQSKYGF